MNTAPGASIIWLTASYLMTNRLWKKSIIFGRYGCAVALKRTGRSGGTVAIGHVYFGHCLLGRMLLTQCLMVNVT